MYLPLSPDAAAPRFRPYAKEIVPFQPGAETLRQTYERGFVLYYTAQCPFTAKYVPILQKSARNHGIPFLTRQITTAEEAQNAPTPFTMFSLFYNGMFVTHEILSEKKFEKILEGVK